MFSHCLVLLERAEPAAVKLLQDLLTRYPDHAPGWEAIGQALLRARKAEAALACFERATHVSPSCTRAMGRGSALRMLGRVAEARDAFDEAGRLDPHSGRATFLLALSAQDLQDFAAARDGYLRVLANNPELVEAHVNLGTVLQAMGDLEGAKQAYGAAVRQRGDTFGRVSQAMTMSPKGELWLDLESLRRHLAG
ncbi:tetratricopeptide repeat protein [Lichenifustis flavocetrariae]|uniref:Tetratricopeptide repeat protein n=1 Tax=Lichenifustis flavocetrariae TaxID=2949735 RepID=A0AA41YZQ8_9HYPH|nr:tetratricopeptide repeat protein [Lichenifustis flavocetrariae]MCW6507883.1 tetratricopeptide repeat protein [Lichenifustis flavocetrariae]